MWLPRREDFFRYLRGASSWSLTEQAQRLRNSYGGAQNPQVACVSVAPPLAMLYLVHTEIEVLDDRILIHSDWMNVEPVVYMDEREHPSIDERTPLGHTIGRWKGATLVMDTTNFTAQLRSLGAGVPSGRQKHVVERLTLDDDRTALTYRFEIEDPEFLREPITGSARWDYRPDLKPASSECDLETAQRFLALPAD